MQPIAHGYSELLLALAQSTGRALRDVDFPRNLSATEPWTISTPPSLRTCKRHGPIESTRILLLNSIYGAASKLQPSAVGIPTRLNITSCNVSHRCHAVARTRVVPLRHCCAHCDAINSDGSPRWNPSLAVIGTVPEEDAVLRWQRHGLGNHDLRVVVPEGLFIRRASRDTAVHPDDCLFLPSVVLALESYRHTHTHTRIESAARSHGLRSFSLSLFISPHQCTSARPTYCSGQRAASSHTVQQ
jgi:hypothetical protein